MSSSQRLRPARFDREDILTALSLYIFGVKNPATLIDGIGISFSCLMGRSWSWRTHCSSRRRRRNWISRFRGGHDNDTRVRAACVHCESGTSLISWSSQETSSWESTHTMAVLIKLLNERDQAPAESCIPPFIEIHMEYPRTTGKHLCRIACTGKITSQWSPKYLNLLWIQRELMCYKQRCTSTIPSSVVSSISTISPGHGHHCQRIGRILSLCSPMPGQAQPGCMPRAALACTETSGIWGLTPAMELTSTWGR